MYEYEDTLYIIEDSNNNNIHIINLKQLLSKLKHSDKNIHEIKQFNKIDEIIKLNIDGISHIDAENVYANQKHVSNAESIHIVKVVSIQHVHHVQTIGQ